MSDSADRPLAEASRRLRRPAGRPRRVDVSQPSGGLPIHGAPSIPAKDAGINGHFATTVLPQALPIVAAAQYSGIPVRRLWAYIAQGRLRPIRPPGMRRVLLDRRDLDELLEASKEKPGGHHAE